MFRARGIPRKFEREGGKERPREEGGCVVLFSSSRNEAPRAVLLPQKRILSILRRYNRDKFAASNRAFYSPLRSDRS